MAIVPGKALMICGTTSDAGKSTIALACCRFFARRGWRVAPFKAQNMALNAAVAPNGGELGIAQVLQAEACGLEPDVRFNPVLLKPQGNAASQVVLLGKVAATLSAREYHGAFAEEAWRVAQKALRELLENFDLVILEGAGSPAEMNLYDHDFTNLRSAREAQAPVVLVGDIERGGVLASLVGTLEVLPPEDRNRIQALVVNKFRGDPTLFDGGVTFLERRTGLPVLGVLPHAEHLRIPAEDSLGIRPFGDGPLRMAVLAFPHMANFTDFDTFASEGFRVDFIHNPAELEGADLVVLPGTKMVFSDLRWLRRHGFEEGLRRTRQRGVPLWGICGGYQMLGTQIEDPSGVEEQGTVSGLGFLDACTIFEGEKIATSVTATIKPPLPKLLQGIERSHISGYEIHAGRTKSQTPWLFLHRNASTFLGEPDGAVSADGLVFGCYLHGLGDDPYFRRTLTNALRKRQGLLSLPGIPPSGRALREAQYDAWTDFVGCHLNMGTLENLVLRGTGNL